MLSNLHVVIIIAGLYAYKTIRRRAYITSLSIPPVCSSPWTYLFNKDDKAFIYLTGLNVETFMELHQILFCNFDTAATGRKEKLDSFGCFNAVPLLPSSVTSLNLTAIKSHSRPPLGSMDSIKFIKMSVAFLAKPKPTLFLFDFLCRKESNNSLLGTTSFALFVLFVTHKFRKRFFPFSKNLSY